MLLAPPRLFVIKLHSYTDARTEIREARFRAATSAAAKLIERGRIVFSPVTMTHPIDRVLAGEHHTLGSKFWVRFDEPFMERCDEIVILRVDGWEKSSGVSRERRFFQDRGLPVSFMDPIYLMHSLSP